MTKTHSPVFFLELDTRPDGSTRDSFYRCLADLSWSSIHSSSVFAFDSVYDEDQNLDVAATFRKYVTICSRVFVHDEDLLLCCHIINFKELAEAYKVSPSLYVNLANLANNSPSERITALMDQVSLNHS